MTCSVYGAEAANSVVSV